MPEFSVLRTLFHCLVCIHLCSIGTVLAQSDDFDDGNDESWVRADPLSEANIKTAVFSFPDGAYRIRQPAPPNTDFGQARAGSYREESYEHFMAQVDVVNWNEATDQDIGILANAANFGLGKTTGYALTFDTSEQAIYISILDSEVPSTLGTSELDSPLSPATGFRMIFTGIRGDLKGEIYALNKLDTPLAVVEVFDEVHAMGQCGVFASAGPDDASIDVTFDNYMAVKPDVPALPLFEVYNTRLENGNLVFNFEIQEDENYGFEGSVDLDEWDAEENATFSKEGTEGKIEVDIQTSPFRYFRITR